jgi:carboxyl-terminal processing protease
VAGALKENQRGRLVGKTTFGKWSLQKVRKLDSVPAAIRMTVAKFYPPSGQDFTGSGVVPHAVVERPDGASESEQDPQLDYAIQIARSLSDIR